MSFLNQVPLEEIASSTGVPTVTVAVHPKNIVALDDLLTAFVAEKQLDAVVNEPAVRNGGKFADGSPKVPLAINVRGFGGVTYYATRGSCVLVGGFVALAEALKALRLAPAPAPESVPTAAPEAA